MEIIRIKGVKFFVEAYAKDWGFNLKFSKEHCIFTFNFKHQKVTYEGYKTPKKEELKKLILDNLDEVKGELDHVFKID